MIGQDDLDALWDFDDPIGSQRRLRTAADASASPDREEYLTQVARSQGLQDRFAEARTLLDELDVAGVPDQVGVRIALERGRVENSAGQPARAVPLFVSAAERAAAAGLDFLRIDALHMLAIADPDGSRQWTDQALELAEAATDPRTRRWAVSLHNNRGWALIDAGDVEAAIVAFTAAVSWAEQVGTPLQQRYAREALAEARQAQTGQAQDAAGS